MLQSRGLQRVGHDWATESNNNLPWENFFFTQYILFRKWNIFTKMYVLPAALNFYLNVFSSQERKTFGGNFPQLSNDYLPAKNTPPLAIKLVYFPRTIISFWLYLWVFKKNIFMRFYFNKILGKGFIAWLLSKTVVLKSSELPGGLAHNQRFWFSERGLKICISNKSLSDSQATHSETKLWEPLF